MRRVGTVLVGLLATLLLAAPAVADDEFEVDGRLADAGLEEPFTTLLGFGRGVRVHVDYRSLSADQAAYEAEAREAAELIWQHLEYRVLAVDVAPTSGVVWRDGDVPPAVSLTRGDLEAEFGVRPQGLDDADPFAYEEFDTGPVAAVVGWSLLGLLVAGGIALIVWARRGKKAPASSWGPDPWAAGWGAPPGPWPPGQPGAWQQGGGWVDPAQGWAAPTSPPPAAGPWSPPGAPR